MSYRGREFVSANLAPITVTLPLLSLSLGALPPSRWEGNTATPLAGTTFVPGDFQGILILREIA